MSALLEISRVLGAGRAVAASRPNRISRLTEQLRMTFEATESMLGRDRFADVADAYLAARSQRDIRTSSYSMAFPAFLARSPQADELPYVTDLARLELAVRLARHSPITAGRDLEDLRWRARGGADFLFDLQLSLQLVVLRWPVLEVWQRHQSGEACDRPSLFRRPSRLQLVNRGGEVAIRDLSPAAFAFRHALRAGDTLERAVERALKRDPLFDLVSELLALFDENLVVGIRRTAPRQPGANT